MNIGNVGRLGFSILIGISLLTGCVKTSPVATPPQTAQATTAK